jgi:hypothetical protein
MVKVNSNLKPKEGAGVGRIVTGVQGCLCLDVQLKI